MKRDWSQALAKCSDEGICRACGSAGPLDPAHIIPRSRGGDMSADAVVPLCRGCHRLFDSGELELLGSLTLAEQSHAVALVGAWEFVRRTTVQMAA